MQETDQAAAEGALQDEGRDAKPQSRPNVNAFAWMRFLLLRLDSQFSSVAAFWKPETPDEVMSMSRA